MEMILSDYAVKITQEDDDFVVSVRDLPEVVTSGDTFEQALELAEDGIAAIVELRMAKEMDLPEPSPPEAGEHLVPLRAHLAAKAAVYRAWKASGLRKTELAKKLALGETEVRRILDPRHGTKLSSLEAAAKVLGGRISVDFKPMISALSALSRARG